MLIFIYIIIFKLSDTKINIPKFMSKKTSNEIKNIILCHLEDGLAIT